MAVSLLKLHFHFKEIIYFKCLDQSTKIGLQLEFKSS